MIREAVKAYEPLAARDVRVIPQGSYRNNTNVRAESDVDICVCCMEPFFCEYSFADYQMAESGVIPAMYNYFEFKNDVEKALVKKFGRAGVTRGNKAFDVHANTYRVDADVVAAWAHRRYQPKTYDPLLQRYLYRYTQPEGTQFSPDGLGGAIVNWPEQHYTNGVAKNRATGYRFKSCTRALKNLKYDMEANGNWDQKQAARTAPSYLVECLMYNVPTFADGGARAMVRDAIAYSYGMTSTDDQCKGWLEVNELKWLFRWTQPWTRIQANTFLLEAWRYGEFS